MRRIAKIFSSRSPTVRSAPTSRLPKRRLDVEGYMSYVIAYEQEVTMVVLTATEARKRLYKLLDSVAASHEPVRIAGKRNAAVLIAEEDWRAIQETLYLSSIPGMRESIINGLKTPVEACDEELEW